MHAAFDGKQIVGGAGVFPFEMTVPGGPVPCAGVTVVGVLPTHRRRGLLSRMMRAQIDDIHERGEPFAALWASEPTIYGRFGYGHASLTHETRLPRVWAALRAGTPARIGQVRLVEQDEALKAIPRMYQKVAKETPGFLSRSKPWWELRRLRDDPSRRPPGSGPLNRALLEIDGRAAGYALYRIVQSEKDGDWKRNLRVVEALGVDPTATREIWRFLLEVDWTDEIQAWLLPTDHPLQHLVARPDRLDLRVDTGLWVRPVDVGATLSARSYRSDSRITFERSGLVLRLERGHVDARGRSREAIEPSPRSSPRRPGARLGVPRRLLLRGALASRPGRGSVAGRARACRCAVRLGTRPLVPRDLLTSLLRGNLPEKAQVPTGRRIL